MVVPQLPPEKQQKIIELSNKYKLDDRARINLTKEMANRLDSFDADMVELDVVLGGARNPPGLLNVKLREMREGTWHCRNTGGGVQGGAAVGSIAKPDDFTESQRKTIEDLTKEYKLDQRVLNKLTNAMSKRKDTFDEDMAALSRMLKTATNPPGFLHKKLDEFEDG